MRIIFFGDTFGRPGREALKKIVPIWQEKYSPDAIIANVENIAHGNGINEVTLGELRDMHTFTVFTSGDHIWDDGEAKSMLQDPTWTLVRPENFPPGSPGKGYRTAMAGSQKLLVCNILGRSFIRAEVDSPFRAMDDILSRFTLKQDDDDKEHADAIFVDFHAETTSEKRAMGFYLDGRISALVGTHTHVPTADAQVLPAGTAYLTDAGMVGPFNSSIGLEPRSVIDRFLTQMPAKKEVVDNGRAEIGAALIDVNRDGNAKSIQQLREIIDYV
ncbi:MAG: YmdB family metallophosphoesterase [Candidatus Spechtbacteria bacterium]|nr:YmdB family metallophosphoesterase [Candidatus Spechtbacteria bacterium]